MVINKFMKEPVRKIHLGRLHTWLSTVGPSEGRARLARTMISFQTLDRMLRGQDIGKPRQQTMKLICDATELHLDYIFPVVGSPDLLPSGK